MRARGLLISRRVTQGGDAAVILGVRPVVHDLRPEPASDGPSATRARDTNRGSERTRSCRRHCVPIVSGVVQKLLRVLVRPVEKRFEVGRQFWEVGKFKFPTVTAGLVVSAARLLRLPVKGAAVGADLIAAACAGTLVERASERVRVVKTLRPRRPRASKVRLHAALVEPVDVTSQPDARRVLVETCERRR